MGRVASHLSTPEELREFIENTHHPVVWVPRLLLIETLGVEKAQKHLQALPEIVPVKTEIIEQDL